MAEELKEPTAAKTAQKRDLYFRDCVRLMRGEIKPPLLGTNEDGFHSLLPHASEYIDELLAEYEQERKSSVRFWLLELIAYSKSPKGLLVLTDALCGDEPDLWGWAILGLKNIDTHEARKILWEARSYTKSTPDLTDYFHGRLAGKL